MGDYKKVSARLQTYLLFVAVSTSVCSSVGYNGGIATKYTRVISGSRGETPIKSMHVFLLKRQIVYLHCRIALKNQTD